ncbi:hypothetical protein ACFVGV_07565 [Pseudarthrobacter scleromae]|uniref:hypothetical protein n=1 Tax=Pseudarthrobacter scleromae TaxID=158897 RepID=UPI0036402160
MTPQAHLTADAVEEILLDAGLGQDADLRRALLAVGSLADLPVPAPTGQLAALLATGTCDAAGKDAKGSSDTAQGTPGDELGRHRLLRAHRPTVVGLALLAGMGMGVGTVAASSPGPAHSGSPSVQQLLEDWSPSWTIRTPQAAAPGPLQEGSDDAAQDDGGLAGGTTPGGEPPVAPQPAEESGRATAFLLPGQGWEEPGEVPAAGGQNGTKEPEKNGHAAEDDAAAGPEQTGGPDARDRNGNTPETSGQLPVDAPGVPGKAGQGPSGRGTEAADGEKPVPGATWREKFVR